MLNQLQISALDLRLSIMAGVLAVMALVFHALGSVLGALIIQFLESGLLLLDVGIGMHMVIIGQVLIAAVVFDVLISHDMPDVFGFSDRLSVMKYGKTVGTYRTSEGFGKLMTMALMTWTRTGGGHEAWDPLRRGREAYVLPSGTGQWSATPPAFAAPLLPYWGSNRPFVLTSADDCPAPPPPAYSEAPGSPFPEFPSGHSGQSSAAAAVLAADFGVTTAFVDNTHNDRGWGPRSFKSFQAVADEAGLSRLYAGIHFRSSVEAGQVQGLCVANKVLALKLRR